MVFIDFIIVVIIFISYLPYKFVFFSPVFLYHYSTLHLLSSQSECQLFWLLKISFSFPR